MSTFESSPTDRVLDRGPQYDRLLTSISHHFLRIEATELQEGIVSALRSVCEATGAERAVLYEVEHDELAVTTAHTFATDNNGWDAARSKEISMRELGWLRDRLARREMVHIQVVAELPEEARAERACLEAQDLQSVVCVPLFFESQLRAIACFATTGHPGEWDRATLSLVR